MKTVILIFIVLCGIANAVILDDGLTLMTFKDEAGLFDYEIPRELIDKAPRWDGESMDLPIALPKAVGLARTHIQNEYSNSAMFEFDSVSLMQWSIPGSGRWFYWVWFKGPNRLRAQPSYSFIVLMDGTVLEPKRENVANKQVEPIVTTPVDEVEAQSTQAHP